MTDKISFKIDVEVQDVNCFLNYNDPLFFMGSCFASGIGRRMHGLKFDTLLNPFGILYHPSAIRHALTRIQAQQLYTPEEFVLHEDRYYSFDHHGSFSSEGEDGLCDHINISLIDANQALCHANFVFITLGSSFVYRHKAQDRLVANCHKIPANNFAKELSSYTEIESDLDTVVQTLAKYNTDMNIVFTVSPVRHVRDGIIENNRSKARLILGIESMMHKYDNCFYFPAYEILNDELRDYRFFAEDMVHPSKVAEDYIFSKFKSSYFSAEAIEKSNAIEQLNKRYNHKALYPESDAHYDFLHDLKKDLEVFMKKNPEIDFSEEYAELEERL